MATKILKKLTPMEGVGMGQRATLDNPIGPRYHKHIFRGTVTPDAGSVATLDDIFGLIRVEINGKVQREMTGLELAILTLLQGEQFFVQVENITNPGNPLANGDTARFTLTILYAETFRKSYSAGEVMAWPTRWPGNNVLGTFQITIDTPNITGYTGHDIEAYAVIDNINGPVDAAGAPIFQISKWYRSTITYTASGERVITTLPKRDMLQQLNFFTQVGDAISHVKVIRDGEEIMDVDKSINDFDLVQYELNADAMSEDRLDVIFDRDDIPDSALPLGGVQQFEVTITLAAAAAVNKAITLVRQTYGPRD